VAGPRRGARRIVVVGLVLGLLAASVAAVLAVLDEDDRREVTDATAAPNVREREKPTVVRFTVSTSGDLLIHAPVWQDALELGGGEYDFGRMFKPIRRFIRGTTLAICHVETPVTTGEPSGYPLFSAPAALAGDIRKAGWRICDTASNHSLDQGQEGIDETGRLLDRAGVVHTGSFSGKRDSRRPVTVEAGAVKVGLLAYTDATNGLPPPSPWSVNLLPADDPAGGKARTVARDARRLDAAGADAIIVSIHWGDENSTVPNRSQLELARKVLAIDEVDAIAGHGPHVVQPIERIGGKFVVFSAGNLLSNQGAHSGLPTATQDGLIALFRFRLESANAAVERVDYVPTWVRPRGHVVLPAGLAAESNPEYAGELADSWARTVEAAGRGDRIRPIPPRPR